MAQARPSNLDWGLIGVKDEIALLWIDNTYGTAAAQILRCSCTAAEHRLAGEGPVAIEDFRDEPTIVLEDMHCLALQTQSFCTGARISPRVVCRTTQLSTIFELVALGLGFSIVPEMAAVADHGRGKSFVMWWRPHWETTRIG